MVEPVVGVCGRGELRPCRPPVGSDSSVLKRGGRNGGAIGARRRPGRRPAEGHWVFAGGLGSPDPATVIDNRGDEAVFADGPYVESKEYVAGFWIIAAPDLAVALKLAAEGSKHCNRRVEMRRFL